MKLLFIIIGFLIILTAGFLFLNRNKNIPDLNNIPKKETSSQSVENNGQEKIKVIAENLDTPWAITFLPDGGMLITERPGRVRFIDKSGKLDPNPIKTLSQVKEIGEGGLMGIVLHPKFAANNYVYFYYTYSESGNNTFNRVVRMIYKNNKLEDEKIIVDRIPGASNHNGGRIKFGPDGNLYITTGDAQNPSQAQNINSLAGKILRVSEDGKPVSGNPFNNLIYSYGHRNPQGLAWDKTGQLWEAEHGPSGIWPNCCQDEINKIEKGKNYGWPQSVGDIVRSGTIDPVLHSDRDIWAPAGMAYLNESLFFGGLRGKALYEYKIVEKKHIEHFNDEFGRIREVVLGPDNMLYITTSNRDGRGFPSFSDDRVIRIDPSNL